MNSPSKKSLAPLYMFLLFFAALIGFLYWITNKKSKSDGYPVSKLRLTGENRPAKIDNQWEKEKDLNSMKERDAKMVQELDDGSKIFYTIDPQLQLWVLNQFKSYNIPYGAAVLMTIPDGKVIVLAGSSSMDPKLTSGELTLKAWAPAASVIKVVTAASLLTTGKVNPSAQFCFSGGKRGLKPSHFTEDTSMLPDCEDLYSAMGNSRNVIFGRLGNRFLTRESYLSMATLFGFNRRIQFDFPIEKSTIKISEKIKYSIGYTSAGFGNTTLSPFHAAWIMGMIANSGKPVNPYIISSVQLPSGKLFPLNRDKINKFQTLPLSTVSHMTKMLEKTVTQGTAMDAFYQKNGEPRLNFTVVGKTGTLSRNKPVYLQYTWFAGFAPKENPKVAFAFLVVNPAKWRTKATFMAQRLLLRYFKSRKTSPKGQK
jgi:penicillin-binding protein A